LREGKNTKAKRYGCGGCEDQNKKEFIKPSSEYVLREVHTKIKKIYTIDNGFIEAGAYSSSQDMGKFSENKDPKWKKRKSILF